MKIVNNDIETNIYLNKECFYTLIFEDKQKYRDFIKKIVFQLNENEEFLHLYDNNKELDFSKKAVFIDSCFNLALEEKKLTNYVQKDLIKNFNEEDISSYNELIIKINEYIKKVTLSYDLPLTFDNDLTINDFIKSFNVKVSFVDENFLLNFIDKVKSLSFLLNKNIFIFNNLHLYFNNDEIKILKEEFNKLEVYFMNISSFYVDHLDIEKVIIIDKDLCEITINI